MPLNSPATSTSDDETWSEHPNVGSTSKIGKPAQAASVAVGKAVDVRELGLDPGMRAAAWGEGVMNISTLWYRAIRNIRLHLEVTRPDREKSMEQIRKSVRMIPGMTWGQIRRDHRASRLRSGRERETVN